MSSSSAPRRGVSTAAVSTVSAAANEATMLRIGDVEDSSGSHALPPAVAAAAADAAAATAVAGAVVAGGQAPVNTGGWSSAAEKPLNTPPSAAAAANETKSVGAGISKGVLEGLLVGRGRVRAEEPLTRRCCNGLLPLPPERPTEWRPVHISNVLQGLIVLRLLGIHRCLL